MCQSSCLMKSLIYSNSCQTIGEAKNVLHGAKARNNGMFQGSWRQAKQICIKRFIVENDVKSGDEPIRDV